MTIRDIFRDLSIDREDVFITLLAIVFCVMAFTLIAALTPAIIHQHAPTDRYIEVTEFRAENVSTNATEQDLLISRSVNYPTRGDVLLELVLVSNETETHIQTHYERNYFAAGNHTIVFERPLPADLPEGTYYYTLHIEFNVDGVERELYARSNTFRVEAPPPANETVTTASANTTTTTAAP